jgi:hypothetical protein
MTKAVELLEHVVAVQYRRRYWQKNILTDCIAA